MRASEGICGRRFRGSCGGGDVGGLVVDGAEHLAVAVATPRVVPSFDPVEDRKGQVLTATPAMLVEELELQRAEEALGHRVIEAVPDRTHGAEQPGPAQAPAEGPRRVLSGFNRSKQHRLVRPIIDVR